MKNKNEIEQIKHLEMLKDVKEILDNYKIINVLSGSALLGIYRDNELRPNCLGVTYNVFYDQIKSVEDEIKKELTKSGFKIERHFINRNWKIRASKGRLQIEICGYSAYGTNYYYRQLKKKQKLIPRKFMDETKILEFKGIKFNVPEDIESFLEFMYNDWETPVDNQTSPTNYKTKNFMRCKK